MRSASAGRSDTIEEETVEDMEAERTGVVRAYSLNSKQGGVQKPVLQSHSSTESTDVPTPKSTPNRGKKKLSLKKCKSEKATEETETRGRGKAWRGRRGGGGGRGEMVGRQSPAEDSSPPLSPAAGHQETSGGFPELFRQAILEVDQLTQQLGEDGRRGEDWRGEEGDSSEGGEEKVVQHKSRPGSKRRRKKAMEAEANKQENDLEAGGDSIQEKTPSITPTPRSASFTALDTVEGKCEDGRARLCLSSSPPPRFFSSSPPPRCLHPSASHSPPKQCHLDPTPTHPPYLSGQERADDGGAFLLGSSTLPRCTKNHQWNQPNAALR